MAYSDNEESLQDGEIVELYKFTTTEGSTLVTSANVPVVHNLETYLPIGISRDSFDLDTAADDPRSLTVKVPRTFPVILRYIQSVPPDKDMLTIFRGHIGTTIPDAAGKFNLAGTQVIQYFEGFLSSVAFKGSSADINVVASNSIFSRAIPKKNFRHLCNHLLYDSGCAVSEVAFRQTVTVTAITGNVLTLAGVPAIGSATPTAQLVDATYYDGGILTQPSGNDTRMIIAMTRGASDTVELLFPFQSLSVGATLTMIPGCAHDLPTCLAKFDNAQRYGGFPYVPLDNPFEKQLGD